MPRALRLLPLLTLLAAPIAHAGGTIVGGQPAKLNMGGTIVTGQPSKLHAPSGVAQSAAGVSGPRASTRGRQVLTQPMDRSPITLGQAALRPPAGRWVHGG